MVQWRKMTKKRKGKLNKAFWILLFFLIMIAVVVFSIFIQTQQKHPGRDAKDYFQVSGATVFGNFNSEDQTLSVQILLFNLTPIGGRASYGWVIPGEGNVPKDAWPQFNLAQGESEQISIYYYQHPPVERTAEGFYPLHVQIDCYEAFGTLTINATRPEER